RLGGKSLVRVKLTIYPDGHTDSQIVLSSGNAELDSAVLKDLKDWKWNPAETGGKPVLSERVIKLKLEAD
ncbi:MAG: TonB family protein, partial [Candidatus Eremiobacteraeota bacterium]|nr:TonB family protein [Candidatus Eremiobacteraeota bacterium]